MCNLNNVIENEFDLEEYSKYMDFIFNKIIDENKMQFNKVVRREDIELGHIHKYEEVWFFHYKVINRLRSNWGHRLLKTSQIGFEEWTLLTIKENRDKRIDELLRGLDTPEKKKLGL